MNQIKYDGQNSKIDYNVHKMFETVDFLILVVR